MDIHTDPGFSRITDPDMALRGNKDPDISMVSGGSAGSPCQYGPQWQHGLWTLIWPQASVQTTKAIWLSVVTHAKDITPIPSISTASQGAGGHELG